LRISDCGFGKQKTNASPGPLLLLLNPQCEIRNQVW
jgi:hypothetical protein